MRDVLVFIPYLAVGYAIAHKCLLKVGDPCPCRKCMIASVAAAVYGAGYYYVLGFKAGFSTPEYVLSLIPVAAVGAAVALLLCPLRFK
jgi:hypothetical protein